MDNESGRRLVDAEAERQQHERDRQAAELARIAAEEARVAAESGRRVVAGEVSETVAALQSLLQRMEAVEALRRDVPKEKKKWPDDETSEPSDQGREDLTRVFIADLAGASPLNSLASSASNIRRCRFFCHASH
jgi:hypothetical protein